MNLIELNDKINGFIDAQDLRAHIGIEHLKNECNITGSEALKAKLDEVNDTDRVLRVGIIGRVKAGKSSLLNALVFDGRDILPKAATPMTAALTRLAYSEDNIRAEIELYSQTDIDEIHAQAQRYQQMFEEAKNQRLEELKKEHKGMIRLKKAIGELQNIAAEDAKKKMASLPPELQASLEQSERIKASATDVATLQAQAQISAEKTDELMGKLNDYVGATGKYMPFTKSVTLYLPEKDLEGLEIVDTPGVNDPVRSREARTNQFLSLCDVVLVVSPAGQFISQEDIDLMARVTTREGIQEAYIIASQTDNQLFGGEKHGETSPLAVMEKVTQKLNTHAAKILSSEAQSRPEMAKIVELYQKNQVICTSGVAHTLSQHLNERQLWDANTQTVWGNLSKNYPDFFSEKEPETTLSILQALANVKTVRDIFADVKARKAQIQADKREKLESDTVKSFNDFFTGVKEYIDDRVLEIETTDVAEEKEKLKQLKEREKDTRELVDDEYRHLVDKMEHELSEQLRTVLEKETRGFTDKNRTQTERVAFEDWEYESDSLGSQFWGWLGGSRSKRYFTNHRDETTIQAGQVVSIIRELRQGIARKLNTAGYEYKESWDDSLTAAIFRGMREIAEGERVNRRQITSAIRLVLRRVPKAEFRVDDNLPDKIKNQSGKLTGREAERFQRDAYDYMYDQLTPALDVDINKYVTQAKETLLDYDLAKELTAQFKKEIEDLINDIDNQKEAIAKYSHMLSELKTLERGL